MTLLLIVKVIFSITGWGLAIFIAIHMHRAHRRLQEEETKMNKATRSRIEKLEP